MARRQADAAGGQQVDERIGRGRDRVMDRIQDLFVLMRSGHGQDAGMRAGDIVGLRPQAAGDDHPAVFGQRLADRIQRFRLGAVQKAAGVDDHRIRARVIRADRVTLGAQARQDAFAVHQRLGATQADHADGRLTVAPLFGDAGAGKVGAKIGRVLLHGPQISDSARSGKGRAQDLTIA